MPATSMGSKKIEIANEGFILQLQKFSVHDGEGVRTTIFLPGCPLRCKWCANPEGFDLAPKPAFSCEPATVDSVAQRIERDGVFFRYSGGGVTFSGGEPTVQQGFLRALAERFYSRGISMWVETCGYFDFEAVKDIFAKMEHVFYDIKFIDPNLHKEYTGVDNGLILENCVKLRELGIPVTVRMPAIKGANFTGENLHATARFMADNLPGCAIELLPYHNFGKEKYIALGMTEHFYEYATPTKKDIAAAYALFGDYGVAVCEYR